MWEWMDTPGLDTGMTASAHTHTCKETHQVRTHTHTHKYTCISEQAHTHAFALSQIVYRHNEQQ